MLVQASRVTCQTTDECTVAVGHDSTCVLPQGYCSNPFAAGCFHSQIDGWVKKRVCSSEDPPNAQALGICQQPQDDANYMEVRLFAQDWESSVFETWLVQIVLAEILRVPTTVETGLPGLRLDFYDDQARFEFGSSVDEPALVKSFELGDCTRADKSADAYEPCAHVTLENWETKLDWIYQYVVNGTLEQPSPLGVMGAEGMFVTKFTVERDSTLASVYGLKGDANRQKLADTFKRPTSW